MEDIGIFYGHLVYFIYRHLVHLFILVCCTKKILATVETTHIHVGTFNFRF
jgi:hypothetical protein